MTEYKSRLARRRYQGRHRRPVTPGFLRASLTTLINAAAIGA